MGVDTTLLLSTSITNNVPSGTSFLLTVTLNFTVTTPQNPHPNSEELGFSWTHGASPSPTTPFSTSTIALYYPENQLTFSYPYLMTNQVIVVSDGSSPWYVDVVNAFGPAVDAPWPVNAEFATVSIVEL
jgi:hypothetical protein